MPSGSFNICCPRDCVSRHNGGTSCAPLKPLKVDSALRALSTLRGLFQGSFLTFKRKLDKFLNQVCDKPCTPGYHQPATSNTLIAQLAQMRADGTFL